MKDDLVRFGVAMESRLVEQLDQLVAARGCNRSELLRDLVRAEVNRAALERPVAAFAAVTIVYRHLVRELTERLTSTLDELGDQVCSSLHVRLDRNHSLETIVLRGRSDRLKGASNRILGIRGVDQGSVEYVSKECLNLGRSTSDATEDDA